MAKIENKDIIEAIKEKTILEVKELVDMMKEEFGVDPSAVAVAGNTFFQYNLIPFLPPATNAYIEYIIK